MSIEINFIQGQKGAACRADAYSVVSGTEVLDIIPAETVQKLGLTLTELKDAFTLAAEVTPTTEADRALCKQSAYRLLGLE